ncbi:hypothetical protein GQ44DRAFT_732683 [Phaeosphaeriaceae sp. PMI808]|nr:hypothetical protein GQ44DRAFT_732683 [Phaeosphaeriaceae sp. PMI808]
MPENLLPRLLPKPPVAPLTSQEQPPPRKRKGHVACFSCRKRKMKCGGQRPKCDKCMDGNYLCEYEAPSGLTGRQVDKRKISALEQSSSSLHSVIDLLRQGSEADAALVLDRIRQSQNIDDAVNTVVGAQALLTAAIMSNDNRLMNHLITLFWTWDNIAERLLYQPLFEEDLAAGNPNAHNTDYLCFCSSFLVNALLALSCFYCLESVTFSVPQDSKTRGRRFAEEAYKQYDKEKSRPSIALMQGQYAMFCYEGILGSGQKAVDFLWSAVKTFKELNNTDYLALQGQGWSEMQRLKKKEGLSWVMWGFYVAEWRSSQAMGIPRSVSKPLIDKMWRASDFPFRNPESVSYWWFPYPMSLQTQRSLKVEIREVDVEFSEIVEDVQAFIYPDSNDENAPLPTTNPERAVELCNALAQWKLTLPPLLRIEEVVTPNAILLQQVNCNLSSVQSMTNVTTSCGVEIIFTALLRPFSSFSKNQFGPFTPKDRCYDHAAQLQSAIWTFRAFAILGHEYWLSHASTTVALITLHESNNNPAQMDTFTKACQCLKEMSERLPISSDCLAAIYGAIKLHKIQLPPHDT